MLAQHFATTVPRDARGRQPDRASDRDGPVRDPPIASTACAVRSLWTKCNSACGTLVEAADLSGLDAALQRAGLAVHPAGGDRRPVDAEPDVVASAAMRDCVVLRRPRTRGSNTSSSSGPPPAEALCRRSTIRSTPSWQEQPHDHHDPHRPDPVDTAGVQARPALRRLVAVELRKMVNTRAGWWLQAAIVALTVAVIVVIVRSVVGDADDHTFASSSTPASGRDVDRPVGHLPDRRDGHRRRVRRDRPRLGTRRRRPPRSADRVDGGGLAVLLRRRPPRLDTRLALDPMPQAVMCTTDWAQAGAALAPLDAASAADRHLADHPPRDRRPRRCTMNPIVREPLAQPRREGRPAPRTRTGRPSRRR